MVRRRHSTLLGLSVLPTEGHGSELRVLALGHMFSDRWAYHLSGGDVLPSLSQVLSGVGQHHLPHCNVQLLRVPSEGQDDPLRHWLVNSTVEGPRPTVIQLVAGLGQGLVSLSVPLNYLNFLSPPLFPSTSPSFFFFSLGERCF